MIRIAVMTFMYRGATQKGELSHADLVALCAKAGAKGIEAFHTDFVDDPGLIPLYRRLLADHGLTMPVVDLMANLVYADARQKQEGVDALRRGLDVCAQLGVEIAHVAGHRPVDGVSLDDARNQIADTLAAHAPLAAEHGMVLAFEDFDPSPTLICSRRDCLQILERAGGALKFVFDTGNFMAAGERADENFAALYPHTCHFHFKDYEVVPGNPPGRRGRPLGQGQTPNAFIAGELRTRGYNGWVALESLAGVPPQEAIPVDMAVLRGWLGV
jgi:sugar phosphate isomerase/epimerase